MTDAAELVKRLRDPENNWNSGGRFEAAAEIERLCDLLAAQQDDACTDIAYANGAKAILQRLQHLRGDPAWADCEKIVRDREAAVVAGLKKRRDEQGQET